MASTPLSDEAAALRRLQREQEPKRPHVFTSERGQAFMLANGGMSAWHLQKYLGHANMSNTIGYVRMSPVPLKDVWRGRQ
jgi:site-specific recombinase XerD